MFGINHNYCASDFKNLDKRIGNLSREPLLHLRSTSKEINKSR